MRWAKILLIFQAIITLIIGVAFFSQLTRIGASDISEIKTSILSGEESGQNTNTAIDKIRLRFSVAAYSLFVIGLVELIIIMRLLS